MRILSLLPLALLTTGCLAPGERDPTRYPWDQPKPATALHPPIVARGLVPPVSNPLPPTAPAEGRYCVIALEPTSKSGITVGGKAPGIQLGCSAPAPGAKNPQDPR